MFEAELVRQRENEVHHMQKEVHRWKCALQKVLKRVAELEKQREKYVFPPFKYVFVPCGFSLLYCLEDQSPCHIRLRLLCKKGA